MNASAEIAFEGVVTGAGNTSSGIFVEAESSSRAVFLRGGATPASLPGSYFSFGDPAINAQGDVVVIAGMLGFQSTLNAGSLALFVGTSGATAQMLARTGDPVPDTGGANIFLIPDNPSINASGRAAFNVVLSGGVDPNAIIAVPEAGATAATLAALGLLALLATGSGMRRSPAA